MLHLLRHYFLPQYLKVKGEYNVWKINRLGVELTLWIFVDKKDARDKKSCLFYFKDYTRCYLAFNLNWYLIKIYILLKNNIKLISVF